MPSEEPSMKSLPDETTIGRVDLGVGDIDTVAAFYEEVIGLEVRAGASRHLDLCVDGVEIVRLHDRSNAPARASANAGLFHLAILVPHREALAGAYHRLADRDLLTGTADHEASEAIYTRDPEGNGVEVYRDRPRERWTRTPEGGVRLPSLPLAVNELAALVENGAHRPLPSGTRLGHVHLEVTDLDTSRKFYLEGLGFDEMYSVDGAIFLAAGGYHHHIALNVWNRRSQPAHGRGLEGFEVLVQDSATIGDLLDRVESAEWRVERSSNGASVWDPDGIELTIRQSTENRRMSVTPSRRHE